jgi:hypothetical protein
MKESGRTQSSQFPSVSLLEVEGSSPCTDTGDVLDIDLVGSLVEGKLLEVCEGDGDCCG